MLSRFSIPYSNQDHEEAYLCSDVVNHVIMEYVMMGYLRKWKEKMVQVNKEFYENHENIFIHDSYYVLRGANGLPTNVPSNVIQFVRGFHWELMDYSLQFLSVKEINYLKNKWYTIYPTMSYNEENTKKVLLNFYGIQEDDDWGEPIKDREDWWNGITEHLDHDTRS